MAKENLINASSVKECSDKWQMLLPACYFFVVCFYGCFVSQYSWASGDYKITWAERSLAREVLKQLASEAHKGEAQEEGGRRIWPRARKTQVELTPGAAAHILLTCDDSQNDIYRVVVESVMQGDYGFRSDTSIYLQSSPLYTDQQSLKEVIKKLPFVIIAEVVRPKEERLPKIKTLNMTLLDEDAFISYHQSDPDSWFISQITHDASKGFEGITAAGAEPLKTETIIKDEITFSRLISFRKGRPEAKSWKVFGEAPDGSVFYIYGEIDGYATEHCLAINYAPNWITLFKSLSERELEVFIENLNTSPEFRTQLMDVLDRAKEARSSKVKKLQFKRLFTLIAREIE